MGTGSSRRTPVARAVKRAVDVAGASLTLVLLAPVVLALAALVRLRLGSPVTFRQRRIGRDLVPFDLVKFRTMRPVGPGEDELLSDADRVTPLGAWLRRTSLDELPTVWNVLRGDMSIVGPRPLLDVHVEVFGPQAVDRWSVRPGITGAAQIGGRQALTFRERLELDLAYTRTWSLRQDIAIVLRTVGRVLSGVGVATTLEDAVDDVGLVAAIRARGRWEHGSTIEPHGPVGDEASTDAPGGEQGCWVPDAAVWFATARQALVAGLAARGVHRIHVPTYGCHDVTRALRAHVEVVLHADRPGGPSSRLVLDDGEAALVVTTFGLPPRWTVGGGTLVLDVTHGPWDAVAAGDPPTDAAGRPADLALASLRKTLPVPDGAVLWSPTGGPLPPAPDVDPDHEAAAARLDAALRAKSDWLDGSDAASGLSKGGPDGWLARIRDGEEALLALDTRPRSASRVTRDSAPHLDVAARWSRRVANVTAFAAAFETVAVDAADLARDVDLLPAPAFVVLRVRDARLRDALRSGLIGSRVYPAILWPVDDEEVDDEDRDLAERILVLHADARYDEADMRRVLGLLTRAHRSVLIAAGEETP